MSAFALAYDFSNASSGTWTFPQTGLHPPSYIPLLAPRSSPNDYAMAPSLQVEGVASLRYPIVSSEISGPERGTPIDVSWSNFLTGQTVRRQLLVSGSFLPGDYDSPLSGARRARPALLSIAGRGLYVRPHARARQSEPTYFATAQSDSLLPPIPWPVRPAESRFEIARSANRALPLLFVEGGATVLRARQAPNHQWQFDAMNVGSPRFRLNSPTDTWDIAYRGTDVGLQRTTAYANGEVLGTWFPFGLNQNVFEAPQTTPTQQSLPHEPRPCTQSDLATTPRVLAPGVRSTRHKVTIVDSPGRENPLWTETAVLYGSSARPCFAAFDASTQNHRAKKTVRALIHSNGIGWLFRTSPKSTRRDVRIEYRAMQCRLGTAASGP